MVIEFWKLERRTNLTDLKEVRHFQFQQQGVKDLEVTPITIRKS